MMKKNILTLCLTEFLSSERGLWGSTLIRPLRERDFNMKKQKLSVSFESSELAFNMS